MTIRDINYYIHLLKKEKSWFRLDISICLDFEKKAKHKNYVFSNGIDFII